MAYISLYRKWRPQTFQEVIGQEFVTRTLRNSLKNGSYAHAYLFTGPRGTGKTSTARILAKALNCEKGPTPDPCNVCPSCRQITEGSSLDIIEIDAASNRRIDDIRDLRDRVIFSPAAARVKVYILDEAHMLTTEANNALLKMLEEPPPHVVFALATTEPHKMPPTILSRCQRFDFRSVPVSRLMEHISRVCGEEGVEASEGALRLIARKARGSVRDALVVLEQVISYGEGRVEEAEVAGFLGLIEDEVLIAMGDRMADEDTAGTVALVERACEEGRDLAQFAREAQEHFRRVFLLQHADLGPEDMEVDEGAYNLMREQAGRLSPGRVLHFIGSLREAVREMQASSNPLLVLEGALVAMSRGELDVSPEALASRVDRLEAAVERLIRREGLASAAAKGPVSAGEAGRHGGREETAAGPETVEEPGEETAAEAGPPQEVEAGYSGGGRAGAEALGSVDLSAVRRAWPRIRERVKEGKVTTHAFLLEGKPSAVEDGILTISFPAGRSFHRGEMEKEDHRLVLERALEEVLGIGLRVTTRLEEDEGDEGDTAGDAVAEREEYGGEEPGPADGGEDEGEPEAEGGPHEEREEGGQVEEVKAPDLHDTGKVKLVKDIFGAEMIEEINLGEEG